MPSILFKVAAAAAIVRFAVGAFADARVALLAAAAAAGVVLVWYLFQARRESAMLLELAGGDPHELAALKQRFATDPVARGQMLERIRSGATAPPTPDPELPETDRGAHRASSAKHLEHTLDVAAAHGFELPRASERLGEVRALCESGERILEPPELLGELLPDRRLGFNGAEFGGANDHARLVKLLADATDGKWSPVSPVSALDAKTGKWVVTFEDNGQPVTWRFKQQGTHISETFKKQLFAYLTSRTDLVVLPIDGPIDGSDAFDGVVVPARIASGLLDVVNSG